MSKPLNVRVADEMADWVDGYALERGVSKTQVVELALKELRVAAVGGVPAMPAAKSKSPHRFKGSIRRERRCWRCKKCITRIFLTDEPADLVPECPEGHGPMFRDDNDHSAAKALGRDEA